MDTMMSVKAVARDALPAMRHAIDGSGKHPVSIHDPYSSSIPAPRASIHGFHRIGIRLRQRLGVNVVMAIQPALFPGLPCLHVDHGIFCAARNDLVDFAPLRHLHPALDLTLFGNGQDDIVIPIQRSQRLAARYAVRTGIRRLLEGLYCLYRCIIIGTRSSSNQESALDKLLLRLYDSLAAHSFFQDPHVGFSGKCIGHRNFFLGHIAGFPSISYSIPARLKIRHLYPVATA